MTNSLEMPYVVASEPEHLSENVGLNQRISVWFNHDLDTNTVNESTVFLFNVVDRNTVLGWVSYQNRQITFTPYTRLAPASRYQLVVVGGSQGIKDVFGVSMPQSYKMEFVTTAEEPPSTPSITSPVDRTVVSYPFTVSWQDGVAPYEVQIAKSASFEDIYWPANTQGQVVVYQVTDVTPDGEFPDGFYYVRVRSRGGAWSEYVGFAVSSASGVVQASILEVTRIIPSSFSANINPSNVVIEFSRELDPAKISPETVYVVKIPI